MTELTKNGVSTTTTPGEENWIHFNSRADQRRYCQYDYRHTDGKLFSCVKLTLDACRSARDEWLKEKKQHNET